MRAPDRGRARGLLISTAALVTMLLAAVLIPSTSSAFTALVANTTDTAASKSRFQCGDTFSGDRRKSSAYFEFGLVDAADATTAFDWSDAGNTGTYVGSYAKDQAQPIACPGYRAGAYQLDGSSSRITTAKQYPPILGTFSEEIWFKTTSGGKLMGFEASSDGGSSNYDKHLYVGASGKLVFGIYSSSGTQTLTTPSAVNDGVWHYAVATTGAKGSVLYLDGAQVDGNSGFTTAENYAGYWRIGTGSLGGWPDQPSNTSFAGSLKFAAAYPYVLSADEVASAWSIGKPAAEPTPTPTADPAPTDTATPSAAPSGGATATASPTKTESTPIYQPAPTSSDISTTPDTQ